MTFLFFPLQSGHTFKITHLFIPRQTGTPDSCDMQHEEELIFYQDKYDLITLGWIHVSCACTYPVCACVRVCMHACMHKRLRKFI